MHRFKFDKLARDKTLEFFEELVILVNFQELSEKIGWFEREIARKERLVVKNRRSGRNYA